MSDTTRELYLPHLPATEQATPERSTVRHIFRLLGRFLAGQRRLFVLALVMLIFEAVTAVFEAYPLAYLIDFLKGDRPDLPARLGLPVVATPLIDTIAILTGAIILLAMINSLADSLAEIFLARGGRMLGFNLRVTLYAHLQRLSLAFHDQRRTGDILTRVTSDVAALEDFVISSLSDIAGSLLVLVGTLAYLLYNSWQVALIAALLVPILAGISDYFSQRIKTASKRQRAREGDLASSAHEMLASIRVVQAYSRADYEQERFAEHSQQAMGAALEVAGLQARFSWVVKVLEAVAIAVVVWVGLWLIDRSAITVGTLVLFVILIQNMFKPTRKIIKEWNRIGKIYASVERIGELLDRQPAVVDAPDAVGAPPFAGHVELRQVSFAYQPDAVDRAHGSSRLALRDVSFSIAPGEVLALVGHTGAGKSTIAQLLPRLYDPHSGQILIDGHDIREFTLESLRSQIGVVLQETILFSGSVAENIAYGRADATREEIQLAARQANAHEFIEKLPAGYDTLLGERGANLSGGQRQRLAIARAFIRNAPILILDEPTTGLDAESTALVLQALRTLMQGKTTIIISHDFSLIRHADKIVLLKEGAIEEVGTHGALLAAGNIYATLYWKQFGDVSTVTEQIAESVQHEPAAPLLVEDAPEPADLSEDTPEPVAMPAFDELNPLHSPALQRELPQLAAAFDPIVMHEHLQAILFDERQDRLSIRRCKPQKAVLLERGGCRLRYEVEIQDAAGQMLAGLVLGRIFTNHEAAEIYLCENLLPLAAEMEGRAEIAPFATPVALIEPLNMVISACPIDGELPTLIAATDRQRMIEVFRELLPDARDGSFAIESCELELGHYGRQHRCVVRYEITTRAAGSDHVERRVIYGKIAADDRGAVVGPVLDALHASQQDRAERFLLPRSPGYLPDLRLALLEAIPGKPCFSQILKSALNGKARGEPDSLSLEQALEISARIAAMLHAAPIELGGRRALDDELAQLRIMIDRVQQVMPDLGSRLRAWLEQITASAVASEPLRLCLSHGDFTYTQIMFDGTAGGLVDFDTICEAEPALDLGQFLAYLRVAALKASSVAQAATLERIEQAGAEFLSAYVAGSQPIDEEQLRRRVALYEAISLLRMAVHSWQKFKVARLAQVIAVLEERMPQLARQANQRSLQSIRIPRATRKRAAGTGLADLTGESMTRRWLYYFVLILLYISIMLVSAFATIRWRAARQLEATWQPGPPIAALLVLPGTHEGAASYVHGSNSRSGEDGDSRPYAAAGNSAGLVGGGSPA